MRLFSPCHLVSGSMLKASHLYQPSPPQVNRDAAQSVICISTKLLLFATCLDATGLHKWKSKANLKARFHIQQF